MSLLSYLTSVVPSMVRACTPSVLPSLPSIIPSANDVSASFEQPGSLMEHSRVFASIEGEVARLYGAERAWLSVSGSTGTNWIVARMLRYRTFTPLGTVLIARNSHLSVIQALTDFGIEFEFLPYDYDDTFECVLPAAPKDVVAKVRETIERTGRVHAVWLTSPTYEGVGWNLRGTVAGIRNVDKSIPIIVDEAWGAHLPAHSRTRRMSAAVARVDLLNASTHKTGGALQGSAVLVRPYRSRFTTREVDAAYSSLTTTSPSYLLLASMEHAYRVLNRPGGSAAVSNLSALGDALRDGLAARPWFRVLAVARPAFEHDPLKVTFTVPSQVSGIALARAMAAAPAPLARVVVEKASPSTVTLLVTFQHDETTPAAILHTLDEALESVLAGEVPTPTPEPTAPALPDTTPFRVVARALPVAPPTVAPTAPTPEADLPKPTGHPPTLHDLLWVAHGDGLSAGELVDIAASPGRTAAEVVTAYPPGIPIVVPGDVISAEQSAYLAKVAASGGHLVGNGGHPEAPGKILVVPGATATKVEPIPAYEVIEATPDHIAHIVGLEELSYPPDLREGPLVFARRLAETDTYLNVITSGDTVAGYTYSHPWGDDPMLVHLNKVPQLPDPTDWTCLYVHDLVVHPAHQGKALVKVVLDHHVARAMDLHLAKLRGVAVNGSETVWANHFGKALHLLTIPVSDEYGKGAVAVEAHLTGTITEEPT